MSNSQDSQRKVKQSIKPPAILLRGGGGGSEF